MTGISLAEIIQWAYQMEAYQVTGPGWIQEARFDVSAKAGNAASVDEMRAMMRTVLSTRFSMTAHREKTEVQGMAMLVGKSGPRLKATEDQGESSVERVPKRMAFAMRAMSMRELAALLSDTIGMPVADLTNLPGAFDFGLDITNYAPPPSAPGESNEEPDPVYIVTRALQDQLGLRIETRKLTIDVLVVDQANKAPSEN